MNTIKVFKYEDRYTGNGFIEMVKRVKAGDYPGVISSEMTWRLEQPIAKFTIEFDTDEHASFFEAFEG